MDHPEIKALQTGTVAEITAALPGLDRDQLTELLALEADCNSPRETLIKAVAARIEKIDADDAPAPEQATTDTKPAEQKAPAHQHPDYAGPLTIEQAEWRHHNLKPAKVSAKK